MSSVTALRRRVRGAASAPDETPPSPPTWGLGDVVIGLAMFAGASTAVVAAVLIDRRGEDASVSAPTGSVLATVLLINVVVFIGVPVLTSRRKGTGSLRDDFGLEVKARDIPNGIAGGFIAIVFSAAAAGLVLLLVGGEVDTGNSYAGVSGIGELVLLHAMVGVLVPTAEELFFRGMLLRSLLRRNGPVLSLAASSALFGLLHVAGTGELTSTQAAMLVSTVVAGLVFGGLTLGSNGRLGPAIVGHIALNQAALALALY